MNNTCVHVNVIKADAFRHKKHRNLTGLITLTFHIKMSYRIIASGPISGIKQLILQAPRSFFSPRPCSTCFACRFSFSPCSTWEPVRRLLKKGLQYYMYYYIVIVIAVFISLQSSSD